MQDNSTFPQDYSLLLFDIIYLDIPGYTQVYQLYVSLCMLVYIHVHLHILVYNQRIFALDCKYLCTSVYSSHSVSFHYNDKDYNLCLFINHKDYSLHYKSQRL